MRLLEQRCGPVPTRVCKLSSVIVLQRCIRYNLFVHVLEGVTDCVRVDRNVVTSGRTDGDEFLAVEIGITDSGSIIEERFDPQEEGVTGCIRVDRVLATSGRTDEYELIIAETGITDSVFTFAERLTRSYEM